MRNSYLLFTLLLLLPGIYFAQVCGTDILHQRLMENDEEYAAQYRATEKEIYNKVVENLNTQEKGNKAIRRIPTVIHVVHRVGIAVGTDENITDAQILSDVFKLNERYAHASQLTFSNPFSGVDLEIQICMATEDPDGNPTNGIIRHADDVNAINNMDQQNTQKAYFWPTTDYMNLYIVYTICDDASCPTSNGVAGYAYFASAHGQPYDGGVFRYQSWWDGLLAHEMGHYFDLNHVFQSSGSCVNNNCLLDGDKVCDTPPKKNCCAGPGGCANTDNTCTTDEDDKSTNNPFRATTLGGLGDQPESMENYMDFTAPCWEAYTEGQKARMLAAIDVKRASLLSSTGCGNITGIKSNENSAANIALQIVPNPASQDVSISFISNKMETVNYTIYNMYGQNILHGTYSALFGENKMSLNISKLPAANYIFSLNINGQIINKRIAKVN